MSEAESRRGGAEAGAGSPGGLRQTGRRIAPLVAVTLLYYAILVYPVMRIGFLCLPDWRPETPVLLLIMVGPLAGRLAYEAGRMPRRLYASASSPLDGIASF